MKRLLHELELDNPNLRATMLGALGNVHPSHLLDRRVARVWAARDPEPQADAPARLTKLRERD